jgi:hypothetical protein
MTSGRLSQVQMEVVLNKEVVGNTGALNIADSFFILAYTVLLERSVYSLDDEC